MCAALSSSGRIHVVQGAGHGSLCEYRVFFFNFLKRVPLLAVAAASLTLPLDLSVPVVCVCPHSVRGARRESNSTLHL